MVSFLSKGIDQTQLPFDRILVLYLKKTNTNSLSITRTSFLNSDCNGLCNFLHLYYSETLFCVWMTFLLFLLSDLEDSILELLLSTFNKIVSKQSLVELSSCTSKIFYNTFFHS